MNDKKYTAYCGLYCLDCIPSNIRLFEILNELEKLLEEVKFDKYAELKAKTNEVFDDYSKFLNVIHEMKKLECKAVKNQRFLTQQIEDLHALCTEVAVKRIVK